MTRVAVTGYASLDHVVLLDGAVRPGLTTTILDRPRDAWPRLGGSPAFVAAALVQCGIGTVVPISWVGDDDAGQDYLRRIAASGMSGDGIAIVRGARTPVAILAYDPDGGCACLYHPGLPKDLMLTAAQHQAVAAADWVCLTIGPRAITDAVLALIGDRTRLAWVVKNDPRALTPEQAARLAGRADAIFASAAEAEFLAAAFAAAPGRRDGQILVETHGRRGAAVTCRGRMTFVPAEAVSVADPTGAGDTFAGGAIAALIGGETEPAAIAAAGNLAARRMLLAR
jgi:ribokinase